MKKLNYLLLTLLSFVFLFACDREALVEPAIPQEDISEKRNFGRNNDFVELPFKARFSTDGGLDFANESCAPLFYNFQDGGGNATHLGKFTTHLNFCIQPYPADPTVPGQLFATYENLDGYFEAANGDRIHLALKGIGKILTTGTEGVLVFRDKFKVVGGTGRFDGAKGLFKSESYNYGVTTEHTWTGTIKLAK